MLFVQAVAKNIYVLFYCLKSLPSWMCPLMKTDQGSSYHVSVSFSTVQLNSRQPVNYNILFNPRSDRAIIHHAGQHLQLTVTGLEPFTTYFIRVQACQIGKYLSTEVISHTVCDKILKTTKLWKLVKATHCLFEEMNEFSIEKLKYIADLFVIDETLKHCCNWDFSL